ncbi:MAG: hypothetical protein ACREVI_01120 [Steroidobacteraceae bacterium]
MRAVLRSTLALTAAAALGFATASFVDRDSLERTPLSTLRNLAPAGPQLPVAPPISARGLSQVPGTLAEILRLRGDFAQTTALYVLASSQERSGIEQLLNEAASIGQASERRAAASILYERYAELDPRAAVAHIMNRGADFDPNWLFGIFHSWSRSDLDAAVAYANTLDDRSRMMGGSAILRARDDLAPGQRESLAAKLNLPVVQQDSSGIDLRTPQAAERSWRSALATEDHASRSTKLHSLVRAWARQDPGAAMRAIESLRDRQLREELLHQGLHAWAEKDARQAAEWALARPPSQERTQLLAATLSALVTRQPSVALDMTEVLSRAERGQVLPQVFANWANTDAQSAAARAEGLEDASLRSQALTSVAMMFAVRHPDEAIRWAAALPDADSQAVMGMVISQIATSDPARASVLVNQMDSGPQRQGAIAEVAQNWSQWDPQAALAWVGRLSASDVNPSIYGPMFQQWAMHDADAAIRHASQMLETSDRDAAFVGIMGSPYLESGVAERLYQRLEGGDARREAAMQLYQRLMESDPESARRYGIEAGILELSVEPVVP